MKRKGLTTPVFKKSSAEAPSVYLKRSSAANRGLSSGENKGPRLADKRNGLGH